MGNIPWERDIAHLHLGPKRLLQDLLQCCSVVGKAVAIVGEYLFLQLEVQLAKLCEGLLGCTRVEEPSASTTSHSVGIAYDKREVQGSIIDFSKG